MESSNLSSDIFLEILTRVSLQTLDNCRRVCKEWNQITYEPSFMQLHCDRTGTVSGFFVQSLTKNEYSTSFVEPDNDKQNSVCSLALDFLPTKVKIEASSNQGILFCTSDQPQSLRNHRIPQYYVCKPSTKEWRLIPRPKTRFFTDRAALIVLRSNPLHYKIVRFSQPKPGKNTCYNLRCEIFDSKYWAWRQSKEIQFPDQVLLDLNPAVLVNGSFHWLTNDNRVFAFDAEQENWTMFPLPEPLIYEDDDDDSIEKKKQQHQQLVEYKGRLGSICMEREKNMMELWVLMEDYGINNGAVWNKIETLSIESLKRQEPNASLAAFYNADIALMKGFYQVLFYKFKNSTCNMVRLDKHRVAEQVFAFQSDWEPSNLKRRSVEEDLKPSSNLVGKSKHGKIKVWLST